MLNPTKYSRYSIDDTVSMNDANYKTDNDYRSSYEYQRTYDLSILNYEISRIFAFIFQIFAERNRLFEL